MSLKALQFTSNNGIQLPLDLLFNELKISLGLNFHLKLMSSVPAHNF